MYFQGHFNSMVINNEKSVLYTKTFNYQIITSLNVFQDLIVLTNTYCCEKIKPIFREFP